LLETSYSCPFHALYLFTSVLPPILPKPNPFTTVKSTRSRRQAFSGQFYRIAIILPGEVQRRIGCDGAKLKTGNEKFFALCPILSLLPNLSSAILQNFLPKGVFIRFLLAFFEGRYR
jgi:hypothetical protein